MRGHAPWTQISSTCPGRTDNLKLLGTVKVKALSLKWFLLLLLPVAALLPSCFDWQYNVTVQGVAFSQVRIDEHGFVIGVLKADTVIGGRPCKQGWVHLQTNGVPVGFTAAQDIDVGRFKIPADTWVLQGKDGAVTTCAFPRDTEIQGHLCRGSGGPTGVQAAFYPDGSLKQYFLRNDTRIQDIPCLAGLFSQSIELHPNGRLKACMLSADLVRDGHTYARGTRVHFDPEGRIIL